MLENNPPRNSQPKLIETMMPGMVFVPFPDLTRLTSD
jgi:hypothetical protein